ncbi:hypothetical protein NPIL_471841 [Nephila pilipes]|uniref:Uncharacterized protein n=1 Tax=Nephila pilipes TaxID=299642 RepID=A0A8X6N4E0_NEPPI|nr:hypothetical protein NPIL_471841 [Nephila pilipes]
MDQTLCPFCAITWPLFLAALKKSPETPRNYCQYYQYWVISIEDPGLKAKRNACTKVELYTATWNTAIGSRYDVESCVRALVGWTKLKSRQPVAFNNRVSRNFVLFDDGFWPLSECKDDSIACSIIPSSSIGVLSAYAFLMYSGELQESTVEYAITCTSPECNKEGFLIIFSLQHPAKHDQGTLGKQSLHTMTNVALLTSQETVPRPEWCTSR